MDPKAPTPHGARLCPVDGATLVATRRAGIEIDHCPTCRGVWLDRSELETLIAAEGTVELAEPGAGAPTVETAPPPLPGEAGFRSRLDRWREAEGAARGEASRGGRDERGRDRDEDGLSRARRIGWSERDRRDDDDDDRDDRRGRDDVGRMLRKVFDL